MTLPGCACQCRSVSNPGGALRGLPGRSQRRCARPVGARVSLHHRSRGRGPVIAHAAAAHRSAEGAAGLLPGGAACAEASRSSCTPAGSLIAACGVSRAATQSRCTSRSQFAAARSRPKDTRRYLSAARDERAHSRQWPARGAHQLAARHGPRRVCGPGQVRDDTRGVHGGARHRRTGQTQTLKCAHPCSPGYVAVTLAACCLSIPCMLPLAACEKVLLPVCSYMQHMHSTDVLKLRGPGGDVQAAGGSGQNGARVEARGAGARRASLVPL